MQVVYPGETFRLEMNLSDGAGGAIPLGSSTAEGRMYVNGVEEIFPATVDAPNGTILLVIDRDITSTWIKGRYQMRLWIDYGEGSSIESRMLYALDFEVPL